MKEIILTETGRTKITEFIPGHLERITKIWDNFSDEELELLLRLLGKAKNAFSSLLTEADVGERADKHSDGSGFSGKLSGIKGLLKKYIPKKETLFEGGVTPATDKNI